MDDGQRGLEVGKILLGTFKRFLALASCARADAAARCYRGCIHRLSLGPKALRGWKLCSARPATRPDPTWNHTISAFTITLCPFFSKQFTPVLHSLLTTPGRLALFDSRQPSAQQPGEVAIEPT